MDKLICAACEKEIKPPQLRFKVWNTDNFGNTQVRAFVHFFHLTDLLERAS